jgi:outer membrane receptor protein involved in Fe transport
MSSRRFFVGIGLSSFLLIVATPALAQGGGTITGSVVQSETLRPLAGAQVSIPETGIGAVANSQGRYLFLNVPVGTHPLRVQMIGYGTQETTVTVASGQTATVDFALDIEALGLDEIVVTGTVGTIQRRAVANVVGTMNAAEELETSAPTNIQQMLTGQIPGVSVQVGSGSVGSGGGIMIRGRSTVALGTQPLLYIDGVRANGGVVGFGPWASDGTSRLNDLNPEEIERIEIIKGPAAATLYGTEASAGVIQVITKKGVPGRATVEVVARQGANWFYNPGGRLPTNYGIASDGRTIISQHPYQDEAAAGRDVFRTGMVQGYVVNVRGGRDNLTYYFSGAFDDEEGYLPNNDKTRTNVRANVQAAVTDELDMSVDLGVVRSLRHTARDIDFGLIATHQFGSPVTQDTPLRGFSNAPPEITALRDWQDRLNRGTVSTTMSHRPTEWLSQRLIWGLDFTDSRLSTFVPRMPDTEEASYFGFHGSEGGGQGAKGVEEKRDVNQTFDYNLTASFEPFSEVTAASSFGIQYFTREFRVTTASSIQMPTPAVSTVSSGSVATGGESYVANKTFGVFAQQTVGWREQLFLTAALRADANSAFGESFQAAYYPKLSGSWVISDADFFSVPAVETLRLRAAWGRSGMQPDAFAAVRTYVPSVGPGDVPTVRPGEVGNPDLKPEVGSELEVGFDASLLGDHVNLEVTHYRQTTNDAILIAASAPSGGFSSSRFVNAGRVENNGWELALTARPIQTRAVGLSVTGTVSHNTNLLADNGGLPPLQIDRRGRFQHIEGWPLGANWSRHVASAQWGGSQGRNLVNIMCHGGPPGVFNMDESEIGQHPPVPCGNAPYFFTAQAGPGWLGSLSPQLTLGDNLTLNALFTWYGDRTRFSTTQWKRDNSFGNSLEGAQARIGELDPVLAASFLTAGVEWPHHQREDHIRLRDISLSYSLPTGLVEGFGMSRATLTVTGRNLWTPYVHESFTDLDPESKHTRDREYGWQLNPPPLPHSVITTLRVRF